MVRLCQQRRHRLLWTLPTSFYYYYFVLVFECWQNGIFYWPMYHHLHHFGDGATRMTTTTTMLMYVHGASFLKVENRRCSHPDHSLRRFVPPNHIVSSFVGNNDDDDDDSMLSKCTALSMINMKKRLTPREEEIQRKIVQLKQQQQLSRRPNQDDNVDDTTISKKTDYSQKLQAKLGKKKSQFYLGIYSSSTEEEDDDGDNDLDQDTLTMESSSSQTNETVQTRNPRLGSLPSSSSSSLPLPPEELKSSSSSSSSSVSKPFQWINPDLFDNDDKKEEDEMSEQDLVNLVEQKLLERRGKEIQLELQQPPSPPPPPRSSSSSIPTTTTTTTASSSSSVSSSPPPPYITTGVGGSWDKNNSTQAQEDLYQPSASGSWGAFPRPRDISKAYGGGRQLTSTTTTSSSNSVDATRERLRQYRERVGIDVASEKDHAMEINEAMSIASYAMQRGVYATAVSALEKVTKYCSTNSKVGGKVFLELAMAYEAVGRSGEAMTVYRTLSTCRMEEIKFNAKRLLYGMEAMQFMRDEAKSADFSRKKIRNTFIDTTGLANIAQQFDDVYQTAYIDLDSSFYRRLTEAVVRSNREARQILLKASTIHNTDAGGGGSSSSGQGGDEKVDRLKIVQALRSLSRNFENALEKEISVSQPQPETVAIMNGKPIVPDQRQGADDNDLNNMMNSVDEFVLASSEQMMQNLEGEWRLQLIADRRGDGVKYFDKSLSWQRVDTKAMTFESSGNVGFLTMSQAGDIEFDATRRVLKRNHVRSSRGGAGGGGGILSNFFLATSPTNGGVLGAICTPQQVMSVDSILLVTQCTTEASTSKKGNSDKDHFAVWRRVDTGTYSKMRAKE